MPVRFINAIIRVADFVSNVTGRGVAWLTLAMVLVTCGLVIARYVFSFGSIALQESVTYMHGLVFMLGIGFTLKEQGHVRVDVLYEKCSERTRTLIDMTGHFVFLLPVALFIFWASIDYVAFAWSLRESSAQPGGLPGVYLLKTLIPAMALLLILQGLSEILKGMVKLGGKP